MSVPPLTVDLEWQGELRFSARAGDASFVLDSKASAGPTPVQALAAGLAGCMAIDVVNILTRGRQAPKAMRARLVAQRAQEDPKRILAVDLRFEIVGSVEPAKVERAIDLSREKYCSAWHSLRQDIEFRIGFELVQS